MAVPPILAKTVGKKGQAKTLYDSPRYPLLPVSEVSTVQKAAREWWSAQRRAWPPKTMATGGRGSVPRSPSPSILFAYKIRAHEKVRKGEGGP